MGWGRMLLLGDIGQQMDLGDLEQEVADLRNRLKAGRARHAEVDRELERLAADHDELKLYVAAILRALVSRGVVSRDELGDLVRSVDAEDGDPDNAYRGDIAPLGTAEPDAAPGRGG